MAKSDPREARIRTGLERLKVLSIDPETASLADLERASGTDPDAAFAVAVVLGDRADEESASLLHRLESAARDKELRREVRRALYRLRQKGVAGADTTAAAPPAAAPPLFAEPEPEGYLTAPDPLGDRLLWIVKPRSGGGVLHLSAVVNEPAGLREAVIAEVGRKRLRALRDEIGKRHRVRLVEVDARYCDWIISEGYERARRSDALGEGAATWPQLRMQLFRRPPQPAPPPIESVLDLSPADEETALAASAEVLGEADFQYWFLPEMVLEPWLRRYTELRDSPILLDRHQQLARLEEIIAEALRELFSGEGQAAWRRRLEELAYVLWKSNRADTARRIYSAARALARSESGARSIPFFEELVRRSFQIFLAREAEREREDRAGSVIVTPDQLREEQARTRSRPPAAPRPKLR